MRLQQVSVDVWKMVVTAVSYLGLAFAVWVLLRLVNACVWLPGHLIKQRQEEERLLQQEEEQEPGPEVEEAEEAETVDAAADVEDLPSKRKGKTRRRRGKSLETEVALKTVDLAVKPEETLPEKVDMVPEEKTAEDVQLDSENKKVK